MTPTTPKISIIMAVYNGRTDHLIKAIESVLTQTFTDFEFLLINDNSNNKISSILNNYVKNDKRIILIQNKRNIGLTKSLNIGIKKSRGKYIARMDSDDIALPHRLKKQFDFLLKNNYDLSTSNCELIDTEGKFLSKKIITPSHNIKRQLLKGNIFVHSTFFGKRKIFEELYNEKFKRAQDYEFLLRIIGKGYAVGNLPKVCLKYRINNMGISFRDSRRQEWSAIQARLLALKEYEYSKLYSLYLLRSFLVFLLPHKLKQLLI